MYHICPVKSSLGFSCCGIFRDVVGSLSLEKYRMYWTDKDFSSARFQKAKNMLIMLQENAHMNISLITGIE